MSYGLAEAAPRVPTQQTIFPLVGGIFRTSHKRLVRVKTEEGDVTETDIDIEGWIILEGFEKKKSGKKRKIEQEGEPSDELETLSISSAESGHRQKFTNYLFVIFVSGRIEDHFSFSLGLIYLGVEIA